MEKGRTTGTGSRSIICSVLFAIFLVVTVFSAVTGNEGVMAPMLMVDQVFLMIWLFKPEKGESKTAYHAIIAYGVFIALLSVFFSVFGPSLSERYGWETHTDDRNGITYPAVNDGRENCYFTSMLFVIYYVVSIYNRFFCKKKTGVASF
ncbi:MAG: hypothetical protein Q8920_11255 [Bacillota bacterium]|nr:hypothetical protein [Bacillota bacterium]